MTVDGSKFIRMNSLTLESSIVTLNFFDIQRLSFPVQYFLLNSETNIIISKLEDSLYRLSKGQFSVWIFWNFKTQSVCLSFVNTRRCTLYVVIFSTLEGLVNNFEFFVTQKLIVCYIQCYETRKLSLSARNINIR